MDGSVLFARIKSLWRSLLHREAVDRDLDEEIRAQVELMADERVKQGMTPEEARRAARIELGGVEQVKEQVRAVRTGAWLDSLAQDVRFALRMLRKSPGFTAVAILTLALGIGANTAIFSVAYGILLKPLPYAQSDRVVQVWLKSARFTRSIYLRTQQYDEIVQRTHSFAEVAAYLEGGCCQIVSKAGPEMVHGMRVSGNFMSVLGAQVQLGRPILSQDDQPGRNHVAVISYDLWQSRFGGDPAVIGKEITLVTSTFAGRETSPYTIAGVMPRLFPFPNRGEILIPEPDWQKEIQRIAVARLKSGVSLAQANAELQTIAARLIAENPKRDSGLQLTVTTMRQRISEDDSTAMLILLAAVGFLLLLACVNVGSLLIARCWARHGEIAIREALGATRIRVIRQLLTESLLLALAGGAVGLPLAFWGVDLFRAVVPAGTPRLDEVAVDWHAIGYTLGISVFSALVFGIVPALLVSQRGAMRGLKEMRSDSFGALASRRPRFFRNTLIVAEISLAFLLVSGSVLVGKSLVRLTTVQLGFNPDHLLTVFVGLSPATCVKPESCSAAMDRIVAGVAMLPGIASASFAEWRPHSTGFMSEIQLSDNASAGNAIIQEITPAYFETMGIPIRQGRAFSHADSAGSTPVAIVNESMTRRFFDGRALGKRFSFAKGKDGRPKWLQVVGIAGDARDERLRREPEPLFYVPMAQTKNIAEQTLLIRSSARADTLLPAIRRIVHSVDAVAPVMGAETMADVLSDETAEPRFQTLLLGAFGGLALLLAVVGIYGVISYSLAQRTRELGIRIALGAGRADVVGLVLGEATLLAAGGIAAGLALSFALTRYLSSLLFEVKPTDAATFAIVAVLMIGVALLAGYVPARRASRLDPASAIRCE